MRTCLGSSLCRCKETSLCRSCLCCPGQDFKEQQTWSSQGIIILLLISYILPWGLETASVFAQCFTSVYHTCSASLTSISELLNYESLVSTFCAGWCSVCVYICAGLELLYQPEVVRLYLSLLKLSHNQNTLEAAAGALQNLSAGLWAVSGTLKKKDLEIFFW